MAIKFLSDEWIGEVEARLNSHEGFQNAVKGQSAKLQNIVTGTPAGDVKYSFVLDGGKVALAKGEIADAEATFTNDYATAQAMSKGETTGQAAFMQGKLKIAGNLMKVMQLQGAFTSMPEALKDLSVDY